VEEMGLGFGEMCVGGESSGEGGEDAFAEGGGRQGEAINGGVEIVEGEHIGGAINEGRVKAVELHGGAGEGLGGGGGIDRGDAGGGGECEGELGADLARRKNAERVSWAGGETDGSGNDFLKGELVGAECGVGVDKGVQGI
jgi:hypothetical protein